MIVPDDKSWTWVLDRQCPECGFDASGCSADTVASLTRQNASAWQRLLETNRIRAGRPDDSMWSSLEYACHVRDVCRRYDQRIALMQDEDDPRFPNWDQDASAFDERYEEQDPSYVMEELRAAANALADRLETVTGEQWDRPGRRSDGASFTIGTIARYMIHDLVHHVWDVTGRADQSVARNAAMVIRPTTASDAGTILSLLNAFITNTTIEWTDTPHTATEVRTWLDEHETVLVAEDRGDVVGVAAYGWFRDAVQRPGYRFAVENTIHIREDHWGGGVGRDLMHALIDDARRGGKHTMVAAIDGENEGSITFHRRLGFVEVARMPQVGAKFGRWLDLVLLQLTLDDRTTPSDDDAPPNN